jgi:transcriptional regulator with XRE-family HTH domain
MGLRKTENFGDRLKKLRQRQEISQEELARRSNLKLSNLAKLEGGFNSNPTLQTMAALAKVLSNNSLDVLLFNQIGSRGVNRIKIENLGQRIKALRQEREISQEELARQSDLKLSNLAKLEGGFGLNPTLTTLRLLAKILTNDSIDKLFAE